MSKFDANGELLTNYRLPLPLTDVRGSDAMAQSEPGTSVSDGGDPLLDDLRAEAAWSAQVKRFAVDLRTKDFDAQKLEDLLEQYKLVVVP
jgi:hypothetical protein